MSPERIRDLFSSFRAVDVRRMFSGAGIFVDGSMIGLVVDAVIYLKTDQTNAADFDHEALPPFQYTAKSGQRVVMSYRQMPERLYDDPEELALWADKSLRVAMARRKSAIKAAPTKKNGAVKKKAPAKKKTTAKRSAGKQRSAARKAPASRRR